ncbi:MAG TPA: carbamate kinase [Clostridiales bacterium]|nr:carbamate kinase [Clostridiales bacterium]
MKKRIVIALGGNALGNTLKEQKIAAIQTAGVIADLVEEGHDIVITHGNGPQIGMIHNAMVEYNKKLDADLFPLSISVGMSQAYIGYDLQNALKESLADRNITKNIATIVTQIVVDANDPAFDNPSKPIGQFMTEAEALKLQDKGIAVMEDAGRGYRVAVPSPQPKEVVEINTILSLLEDNQVVIAGGGGGIPVVRTGNHLEPIDAVIDKDFVSSLIAQEIDADLLVILTAVEKVCLNFLQPNMEDLDSMTIIDAKRYISEGHFLPGSMLPKMQAALEFTSSDKKRSTLITLLNKAKDGFNGKTGTLIKNQQ